MADECDVGWCATGGPCFCSLATKPSVVLISIVSLVCYSSLTRLHGLAILTQTRRYLAVWIIVIRIRYSSPHYSVTSKSNWTSVTAFAFVNPLRSYKGVLFTLAYKVRGARIQNLESGSRQVWICSVSWRWRWLYTYLPLSVKMDVRT